MKCPKCNSELKKVTQSSTSMLSKEQFESLRAGDYYCDNCKGDRGCNGFRYYWEGELIKRTYDWLHKDMRMSFPELSDKQMASKIRMLSGTDLNHEKVVCGARDRIMALHKEKSKLKAENERLKERLKEIGEDSRRDCEENEYLKEGIRNIVRILKGMHPEFYRECICPDFLKLLEDDKGQ